MTGNFGVDNEYSNIRRYFLQQKKMNGDEFHRVIPTSVTTDRCFALYSSDSFSLCVDKVAIMKERKKNEIYNINV